MIKLSWETRAVAYHQQLGNKRRVKFFYKCGSCRSMKVLNRELWEYIRPPKCKCGVQDWRMDSARYNRWLNRTGEYNTCKCNGLHYNHRAGSTVWCEKHPTGPTEEDYIDRYGDEGIQSTQTTGIQSDQSVESTLWD